MYWRFPIAFLITVSLLLSSCDSAVYQCTDPLGCLEIPPGKPIVIGALLTVYGDQGEAGRQAVELIKTAIQEKDLILGHEIQLVWQGTDCSEEYARLSATHLSGTPGLLAVIGPTCSVDIRVAVPILEDAALLPILPIPNIKVTFQRLVLAIEETAIRQSNGALVVPRTGFQQAIHSQP
jgi:ABC-type branched-subunit amino acid transport system substrate-binding protein